LIGGGEWPLIGWMMWTTAEINKVEVEDVKVRLEYVDS
jgi:hypothetical protein